MPWRRWKRLCSATMAPCSSSATTWISCRRSAWNATWSCHSHAERSETLPLGPLSDHVVPEHASLDLQLFEAALDQVAHRDDSRDPAAVEHHNVAQPLAVHA